MKHVIDTNVLIQILAPASIGLTDPDDTSQMLTQLEERVEVFVSEVQEQNHVLLVPTPVLTEFLFGIERSRIGLFLEELDGYGCFEVVDFDKSAAIECALLPPPSQLKAVSEDSTAARVKFDRQIVAICKANSADTIWSHDRQLRSIALGQGITIKSLADVKLPV